MTKKTKAQQEMVGFALIVVLVVVISLVLLILYVKKPISKENLETENLLASMMSFTSECIISPPSYESIEDLIKTCSINSGEKCTNGDNACEYLVRLEKDILSSAKKTDNLMNAYQLDIQNKGKPVIPRVFEGNCISQDRTIGAQRLIKTIDSDISIQIAMCYAKS
jgi:hypothetical protein